MTTVTGDTKKKKEEELSLSLSLSMLLIDDLGGIDVRGELGCVID